MSKVSYIFPMWAGRGRRIEDQAMVKVKERENSMKLGSRNDFQLSEMLLFEIIKCEVWLFVPSLFQFSDRKRITKDVLIA